MPFTFPKIYPILDSSYVPFEDRAAFLRKLGESLTDAGVTLCEYRNKTGDEAQILADARILRSAMPPQRVKLILDDRIDLVQQIEFDGVHVDDGDATPAEARQLLGARFIIGTFGGSDALIPGILRSPADYLSIGPIYQTRTKQTSKAPIGLAGIRNLREQAGPDPVLVAVAGIALSTAADALEAGANVVAVSEALFRLPDPATEFRKWKAELK